MGEGKQTPARGESAPIDPRQWKGKTEVGSRELPKGNARGYNGPSHSGMIGSLLNYPRKNC